MMLGYPLGLAALVAASAIGAAAAKPADGRVSVWRGGPQPGRFLQWRGRPVLPIGDSVTQGWMQSGANFDQRGYLDALAARGINSVLLWSYMAASAESQRQDPRVGYDSPEIWPWQGSPDDRSFDLTAFNPAYFDRLREFVRYAEGKGILVVITVQDGWTKTRFADHPLNQALGNGPLTDRAQLVELADYDREMPAAYRAGWSRQERNQYFQERFADWLIATLAECGNVLFEMFNEGEWYDPEQRRRHEEHFLRFFRRRTAAPLLTNTDHIRGRGYQPRQNPDVDILSFHKQGWAGHFRTFEKEFGAETARVIWETEPVPSLGGTEITLETLRASVWERALSGAGWVAQNDASFGWDPRAAMAKDAALRDRAYDQIGHAARYFNQMGLEFWKMHPDSTLCSTGICSAEAGRAYVAYAPRGGEFTLDLSAAAGKGFTSQWYDPRAGQTREGPAGVAAASTAFRAPDGQDWVLRAQPSRRARLASRAK